uniref:Endonuclease/exonuclease/phosphatase domain-containing protein n=1 Tax=Populus trichocarpa TaxID=3694 RepID=A0A3N7G908_POPTR
MILCFFTWVATFCRVKSAFSSSEVALPVAAEEGFTRKFAYGPQAASEDMERIEFKMKFFKILQKRSMQCWSLSTGAEQFNFGSRIDHILCAGPCLHQEHDLQGHNSLSCHVKECDILTEYKRWKLGDTSRWKGGWGIRLEGSDHAPVYTSLEEIHDIPTHSTLPLSSRYLSANDSWCPANSCDLVNDKAGCYMTSILQDIKFIFRWRCYCTDVNSLMRIRTVLTLQ